MKADEAQGWGDIGQISGSLSLELPVHRRGLPEKSGQQAERELGSERLSSDIVHSAVVILICYKNYQSCRLSLPPEQLLS